MPIKTRFGALVATVLFAAASLPAGGQSGTCSGAGCPDSSFGANGIVRLPSFGGAIGAIAVQNLNGEERIVALNTSTGAWKLTRYRFTPDTANPDKTIVAVDTSFGVSGSVTKSASGYEFTASLGLVIQPDNRIVVAGTVRSSAKRAPQVLVVVRYTADGKEDVSFGSGGTVSLPNWGTSTAPRLQSNGKILLAVPVYTGGVGDAVVVRLDQTGQLDSSFGAEGVAAFAGIGYPHALATQWVDGEEKIVLAAGVPNTAALVRVNADGTQDMDFAGGQGVVEISVAGPDPTSVTSTSFADLAIDALGRIVAAGTLSYRTNSGELVYQVVAARFSSDGNLDLAFADRGVFTTVSPGAEIRNVLIGSDGRILLVGHQMPTFWNTRGLVLWRLQDDGVPDPSFGTDGLTASIVTQDPMSSMWPGFSEGTHVAFVGDGTTFLVGGSAYTPQGRKRLFVEVGALGRFLY
jgi:uncharacterized delta-60 repeat protein